jgi:hypothetical protein
MEVKFLRLNYPGELKRIEVANKERETRKNERGKAKKE